MKETIENLAKAFVGESQARNRYTFYAKIAKSEGFEQIADIFLATAENEKEHAKQLFRFIDELKQVSGGPGEINIEASVPTTSAGTADNLNTAIGGEHYEYTQMYPHFADIAESEGLKKIAVRLRAIAKAEQHHEERYKKLLDQLEADTLFSKDKETTWICRKCGYVHSDKSAPQKCPACDHPRGFYQIECEEY